MSLEMITSFMQPNGTVPKTALTVIKKDNNDVELITDSEDKAVNASLERIVELQTMYNRVEKEGMSRDVVEQLMRIAPSAVPQGLGLEAFTELPTNVMLKPGLEGMLDATLTALKKLIKFLIEKLKAGYVILLDSYQALTGIAPSAYKLAKRQVYNEKMTEMWRKGMQSNLDQDVLEALRSGAVSETSTRVILDGFFNDTGTICAHLSAFEPLIVKLQRAVEDMLVESAMNQRVYNEAWAKVNANRSAMTDEEYFSFGLRISGMLKPPAFNTISQLMDQLAKKVVESKLYEHDEKAGAAIIDRLKSQRFRDVLIGLQQACCTRKPLQLSGADGYAVTQQQDLDELVNRLTSFKPTNAKNTRDFKQQLDQLRVYEKYVNDTISSEDGFEVVSTKFLELQNDVKAVAEVVRQITANYAETIFKLTAFRDRIKQTTILSMVATKPESIAAEETDANADEVKKSIREYIQRVVGQA